MTNPTTTPAGAGADRDYLWDGSGPPDGLVAELEKKLAPLAFKSGAPAEPRRPVRNPLFSWRTSSLIAATIVLAAVGGWLARGARVPTGWEVEDVQGAPAIGGTRVADGAPLRAGDWIRTDAASSATLRAADIGHVTVHPNSRLQLVRAGRVKDAAGEPRIEHRLNLAEGSIEAFVTAEPRLFFVDTPAAVAVDYGCMYTLDVDESGSGTLHVTLGQVRLERPGIEARVPAQTKCRIIAGRGPGTPVRDDASKALTEAVEAIDAALAAAPGTADIEAGVRGVLDAARPRDAITLWHVLPRVAAGPIRDAVYLRLAALITPPQGVTQAGTVALDAGMLDIWWDAVYWAR